MTKLIPVIVDQGDKYAVGLTVPPALTSVPPMVYRPLLTQDGIFLVKDRARFKIPEKIYGSNLVKLSKIIMNDYKKNGPSLGAILNGRKGMGKSLLSEILANAIIDKGLPVLYVSETIPPEVISKLIKIMGPCAVLLEEFDKVFEWDKAVKFIPILSDTSSDGVLFVITANNLFTSSLDPLVDRPQRCKYRINFGELDDVTIDSILTDNVEKQDLRDLFKQWAISNKANVDSLVTLVKMSKHIEDIDELTEYIAILNVPLLSTPRTQISGGTAVVTGKWPEMITQKGILIATHDASNNQMQISINSTPWGPSVETTTVNLPNPEEVDNGKKTIAFNLSNLEGTFNLFTDMDARHSANRFECQVGMDMVIGTRLKIEKNRRFNQPNLPWDDN